MIRKFKASTMQEAMQLAKKVFGDDAIVLHSRKVKESNLSGTDIDELVEITVTADMNPEQKELAGPAVSKQFYTPTDAKRQSQPKPKPVREAEPTLSSVNSKKLVDNTITIRSEIGRLQTSIDRLRDDIRRSHTNILPETYRFLEQEKGLDAELAAELVQNIFLKLEGADIKDDRKILQVLQAEVLSSININDKMDLIPGQPKLICLVGPTGTGKTTSIIKLATHPDFYGRHKVGLITSDTYRVAAAAQLKTFAALAKIPLEIAYEPDDFGRAIQRFRGMDVILVDTAGRSPLNEKHLSDLKEFFAVAKPDEVHLVLEITASSANLIDSVSNFSTIPISNLIVSKVDETIRLGNIFNISKKIALPISFLTNGQKVPDDILLADSEKIARMIIS